MTTDEAIRWLREMANYSSDPTGGPPAAAADLIERLHEALQALQCDPQYERAQADAASAAAEAAARKLREIAETGRHPGTFGGAEMEAAARAILRVSADLQRVVAACSHVRMGTTPAEIADKVIRAHDEIVTLRDALAAEKNRADALQKACAIFERNSAGAAVLWEALKDIAKHRDTRWAHTDAEIALGKAGEVQDLLEKRVLAAESARAAERAARGMAEAEVERLRRLALLYSKGWARAELAPRTEEAVEADHAVRRREVLKQSAPQPDAAERSPSGPPGHGSRYTTTEPPAPAKCPACAGWGTVVAGTDLPKCPECGRSGKVPPAPKPADPPLPEELSFACPSLGPAIFLRFADGRTGIVTFADLGIPTDGLRMGTLRADGGAVAVDNVVGETVHIDAAVLRARIDPEYAEALRREIAATSSGPKQLDDADPGKLPPPLAPGSLGTPNIEPTQFRQKERAAPNCPACGGRGKVTFLHLPEDPRPRGTETTCPGCGGSGKAPFKFVDQEAH